MFGIGGKRVKLISDKESWHTPKAPWSSNNLRLIDLFMVAVYHRSAAISAGRSSRCSSDTLWIFNISGV